MLDLPILTQKVIELAQEAGEFLLTEHAKFSPEKVEYKGKNDLVSYVDKQTEQLLVEGLHQLLPEAGFIAEEGTGSPVDNGYNWIIDPLDGTTNFVHGLPLFSTSIALHSPEGIHIGVVNTPYQAECFHAYKGGGAFCNEKRIHISPETDLHQSLYVTGFPYSNFERLPAFMQLFQELMHQTHGIRRLGSAALDLSWVASGRFEGFFEYDLKPWDVAGGILLVEEAGGKVTDFNNEPNALFDRELIAAGHTHTTLHKRIAYYFGKE